MNEELLTDTEKDHSSVSTSTPRDGLIMLSRKVFSTISSKDANKILENMLIGYVGTNEFASLNPRERSNALFTVRQIKRYLKKSQKLAKKCDSEEGQ